MILIIVFHLTWQVHPIFRRATPFRCECGSSSCEQKFHSQRETLFCMIDCAFIESPIIFCLCLMALISRSLSRLKRELSFLFPFDYSFFIIRRTLLSVVFELILVKGVLPFEYCPLFVRTTWWTWDRNHLAPPFCYFEISRSFTFHCLKIRIMDEVNSLTRPGGFQLSPKWGTVSLKYWDLLTHPLESKYIANIRILWPIQKLIYLDYNLQDR